MKSAAGDQIKTQLAAALEAVLLQREAESTNALEDYRRGKALLFNEVLESEVRQNE